MDERRARTWPLFDAARIRYEDARLIVVDKPPGVPSQAALPEHPDDLPFRLGQFLQARDGLDAPHYLGIHQRLDRATSGLVVFAKLREANAELAAAFETRAVQKTYVAGVRGWRGGSATLRDRLAPASGGGSTITGPRDPHGRDAVTHVRVLERRGDRALVECRIETGRTHQIRVQLSHAHAPIAGDGEYGGAPATRLMLHASALELPRVEGALRVTSPTPPAFLRWLAGADVVDVSDAAALGEAIDAAVQSRWGLAWRANEESKTDAFRLVNEAGDGLPGMAVDVYGDHLVAQFGVERGDAERERVLDALFARGFAGIYEKRRPKQANELVDAAEAGLAPGRAVRGEDAPEEFVVHEDGVPYAVRLGDGLSTGLFLDQRDNRARVRALVSGRSVLNLFAYTGGFTIAACAGGASRSLTVDASKVALARAEAGVARVASAGEHRFAKADAFGVLTRLAKRGETYDVIVVDPPTYSTTAETRWSSGPQWRGLAEKVARVLAPGGHALLCTNDRRTTRARFRALVLDGFRDAGRLDVRVRELPLGSDFPIAAGAEPHLKSVLVEAMARV